MRFRVILLPEKAKTLFYSTILKDLIMSFGGKLLLKTRKTIPGTWQQQAWQDVWQDSIDIVFDGELTPVVQNAIIEAFTKSKACSKGGSSFGALRWGSPDRVVGIDVTNRQLILSCAQNLAD